MSGGGPWVLVGMGLMDGWKDRGDPAVLAEEDRGYRVWAAA